MFSFSTSSLLLTLGLLVLAALFWWWSTRYLRGSVNRLVQRLIRVIRAVVLLLLVLLLVNFQATWQTKSVIPPTIEVFADGSASMSRFINALKDSTGNFIRMLEKNGLRYNLHSFAGEVEQLNSANHIQPKGQFTNVSGPLQELESNKKRQNIQSAILLSDGIHNSGVTPENLASSLKVPVYTMFIGDSSVSPDLEIQNVDLPRIVYAGDSVKATITLKLSHIQQDTSLMMHLRSDSKEIKTQPVHLTTGTYQKSEAINFIAPDQGDHEIKIALDSLRGERTKSNNSISRQIVVRPSRFQVLLVADEPSIETRFLIQTIQKMDRFTLQTYFSSMVKSNTLATEIPKMDILYVLGNLPGSSAIQQNMLKQVKGIIYQSDSQGKSPALNQAVDQWKEEGIAYTNPGENPLASIFQSNMEWSQLPPVWVQKTSAGERNFSGDIILRGIVSNAPVLILKTLPDQRQVALFGQQLWRWDFSAPELSNLSQTQPYSTMLNQLFYWLLQSSRLNRLQVQVQSGEQTNRMGLTAEAQVYSTAFQSQSIARVWGEVLDSTGTVIHRGLFRQRDQSFSLDVPISKPGKYRLRTTAYTPHDTLKSISSPVTIQQTNIEMLNRSGKPELLSAISRLTGGRLLTRTSGFPVHRFKNLPDIYRENDHQYVMRKSYWIWGIIVLLLGVDWWIRRRSGIL